MNRVLMWLICLCGIFILTGGDAFAQYDQAKCPPKQKSWKVRKSLIKFPELVEQQKEKERTAKQVKTQKSIPEKEEKTASVKSGRKQLFSSDRRRNARLQKVDNKNVASTKCPK